MTIGGPSTTTPIALPANQPPDRFYRGGERIAQFRALEQSRARTPEDWVGSTTTLFGEPSLGLTTIDGCYLRDLIEQRPLEWLGADHVAAHGTDTRLLVKLLDAGQRLPVHVHPDDTFAAEHLGLAHGKSEAWYILEGGEIALGFDRDVSPGLLDEMVSEQRVEELLGMLHTRTVQRGDTVFVPAGLPHAIGEGVFLVEVQQPEDLSIMLEWQGFKIDGTADGHLGLGFARALEAVQRQGLADTDVDALIMRAPDRVSTLVATADDYFRIERVRSGNPETIAANFGVLVVLEGSGEIRGRWGSTTVTAGMVLLLPHAVGDVSLAGTADAILCLPPLAAS